jgi:hypothetical protein
MSTYAARWLMRGRLSVTCCPHLGIFPHLGPPLPSIGGFSPPHEISYRAFETFQGFCASQGHLTCGLRRRK